MRKTPENIKLSVCIPTYNRAEFISETLESVICQATDSIEIVVVDGASTDNTAEVVKKYQQKFENLFYYRMKKNSGVDRDMAKTIELARGAYCWMLSDDDLLKPGVIKGILKEIESGYEIYLCNVIVCDLYLQPLKERFWLSAIVRDRVFNLHNREEFIEYCNKANSIAAFFSYMCSIILRREEWNKIGYSYDFDGSAYALASTLLSFINQKCRLKYIRNSLVLWRSHNQTFQMEGGLVKRFLLDFNAYLKLADKYLSDDVMMRRAFLKVMRREHPWYTIIHVSSLIDSSEEWRMFSDKLFKFGYSYYMIAVCYALGRHKRLVSFCVAIKRMLIKNYYFNKIVGLLHRKQKYFTNDKSI